MPRRTVATLATVSASITAVLGPGARAQRERRPGHPLRRHGRRRDGAHRPVRAGRASPARSPARSSLGNAIVAAGREPGGRPRSGPWTAARRGGRLPRRHRHHRRRPRRARLRRLRPLPQEHAERIGDGPAQGIHHNRQLPLRRENDRRGQRGRRARARSASTGRRRSRATSAAPAPTTPMSTTPSSTARSRCGTARPAASCAAARSAAGRRSPGTSAASSSDPNGHLDGCASGGYWGRDVSITNTTGGVTVDDNIIDGQLIATANDPAAQVAANNRIRGGVVGQQARTADARAAQAKRQVNGPPRNAPRPAGRRRCGRRPRRGGPASPDRRIRIGSPVLTIHRERR